MPENLLHITSLRSGGLITNYYCTSACRHCLYRSGPKWPREYISAAEAERNFESIRQLGCTSIHIGGGEPFLKPDKLAQVLDTAGRCGIHIDYVETNSSWYRDPGSCCRILEKLAGHGLSTLLISISPLHNEFIPYARVKGVMAACQQTGINVFPWTPEFIGEIELLDQSRRHDLAEYCARYGAAYIDTLPRRYWISPGGRALETFAASFKRQSLESLLDNSSGCQELSDTSHFHLDLFGNYIPGLCAGLAIRRKDLGTALNPKAYPLLHQLHSNGIAGLVLYARETYGYQPICPDYWSKCELCFEIRSYLVKEKKIVSRELQPLPHYLME